MSNDPEQIRREIERTRSELSDNVNALGDKVNPGSIAKRQVSRVRGAATSVKDAVLGSASDAADSTQQLAGTVVTRCPTPPPPSRTKPRRPLKTSDHRPRTPRTPFSRQPRNPQSIQPRPTRGRAPIQ